MQYNRLILLTAAALILLVSCNGKAGTVVPDFKRFDGADIQNKKITAAHNLRSGNLYAYEMLAAEFSSTNTYGIEVSLDEYDDSGASAADFAFVNPAEASELLKNGRSIELSPLIAHPLWGMSDGRRRFYPAARRQTDYWNFARRITAIPILMDAGILIVNNELLHEAGFDEFPRSWFMTDLLLRRAGKNSEHVLGIEYAPDALVSLIKARGGSILRPAGLTYSFNNPSVIRTLRYLRKFEEKQIFSVNSTKYLNQTEFAFGKLLTVYTDTDGIRPYADLISMVNPGLDWTTALLPTRKPGDRITINCSQSAVIFSGPPESQLASWLFIKWLTEPEQQKKLAAATGSIPAAANVIPSITSGSREEAVPQWLAAANLIDKSGMGFYSSPFQITTTFPGSLPKCSAG